MKWTKPFIYEDEGGRLKFVGQFSAEQRVAGVAVGWRAYTGGVHKAVDDLNSRCPVGWKAKECDVFAIPPANAVLVGKVDFHKNEFPRRLYVYPREG